MFIGYHDLAKLPIQPEMIVTLPKGTKIRTMHPQRHYYTLIRSQNVRVEHLLPGASVYPYTLRDKDIAAYERGGADFSGWTKFLKDYNDGLAIHSEGPERMALLRAYYDFSVHIQNPSVRWPGTGGYWCEADINDVAAVVE